MLEAGHLSGSGKLQARLLFEAMPFVMNYRAGIANKRPEVVQHAEEDLAAIGVKATDRRDGFIEIVALDKSGELDIAAIEILLSKRTEARRRKDWKESDRIRDELLTMGVVLKDSKDGTTWELAR